MAEDQKVAINGEVLFTRLKKLHDTWTAYREEYNNADALVLLAGDNTAEEDDTYQKYIVAQYWLFGYILPNTAVVIGKDSILFLSHKKKLQMLKDALQLTEDESSSIEFKHADGKKEKFPIKVKMVVRKKDDSYAENCAALSDAIKTSFGGKTYGFFKKNEPRGEMIDSFNKHLTASGLVMVDVKKLYSKLLAVKDEFEIDNITHAAELACAVMNNFFIPKMENVIDVDQKILMTKLADEADRRFSEPKTVKSDLDDTKCESAYPPVIQSGGVYDLTSFETQSNQKLSFDTILVAMGGKYDRYCANVGRTYFVEAADYIKSLYSTLLGLQAHIITAMKPGVTTGFLYTEALKYLESHRPADLPEDYLETWESHLPEFLGFGIGLEASETLLSIKKNAAVTLEANMVFSLVIAFRNLKGSKGENVAMWVVDTVVVEPSGTRLLTHSVKNTNNDYRLDEPMEVEEEVPKKKKPQQKKDKPAKPRKEAKKKQEEEFIDDDDDEEEYDEESESEEEGKKAHRKERHERREAPIDINAPRALRDKRSVTVDVEDNAAIKQHQKELGKKLFEESKERLLKKNVERERAEFEEWDPVRSAPYQAPSEYPAEVRPNQIFIDGKKEVVFLPINGMAVPFQISFIKNVSKTEISGFCELRINFHSAGQGLAAASKNYYPALKFPNCTFVRELTYRSPNVHLMSEIAKKLGEMRKVITARSREEKDEKKIVDFGDLQLLRSEKPPRLTDVYVRPYPRNLRHTGVLEAHKNGLRFSIGKTGEQVDIIYNNIRSAFFQPTSLQEPLAILHFHLRTPVKIGKRGVTDVQFCVSVMELSEDLTSGRHGKSEKDEHEAEQRQRQYINQVNGSFDVFKNKMMDVRKKFLGPADSDFEFDFESLNRSLAFLGTIGRGSSLLYATEHALVNVQEQPFFVIELKEVEFVCFERLQPSLKTFDLAFVLKDYTKMPHIVSSVPAQDVGTVKTWLNEINMKFYQHEANQNWPNVLKMVTSDLVSFFNQGGWNVFFEGDEGAEDEEESADEEFAGEEEEESEEEESDDEYAADEEEDEDDESEASGDEEEEGEDWEELDRKAAEDDNRASKREIEEEQEEAARRKKRRD